MKVIDTPRTGKIGNWVAYISPFGQCFRALVPVRNPRTAAQIRARAAFGSSSSGWGLELTEPQRQRWVLAAQTAPSHPSLSQYSHLSGQQLCVQINSVLRCVGQAPTNEPPVPIVFSPNPVGDLVIDHDEQGRLRMLLSVGAVTEDIMVFGQAPCSAGRMKQRRVCYLGLLGPATNGQCDIADLYTARFGQPSPGQKVFIVTAQEKNGWKAPEHATNAIVPPWPAPVEQQRNEETKPERAAPAATPQAQQAPAQARSSLSRTVYKGCTPDAPGMHSGLKREHPVSTLGTPLVHGLRVALACLRTLGMSWVGA